MQFFSSEGESWTNIKRNKTQFLVLVTWLVECNLNVLLNIFGEFFHVSLKNNHFHIILLDVFTKGIQVG